MKDNILILGGSWEQKDMFLEAIKKYNTILVDKDKNAFCKQYADVFYPFSIRDYKKVIDVAKNHDVIGVTSMITEIPLEVQYKVCNELDLHSLSYESMMATRSKLYMRKRLRMYDLNKVQFSEIHSYNDIIKFYENIDGPIILKPSGFGGQKGLYKFSSISQIKNKKRKLRKDLKGTKYLAEEFIEGRELNSVFLLVNGKIKEKIFSDRIKSKRYSFGVAQAHSYPANIEKDIREKISIYVNNLAKAVGLKNGVIFPQFIINKQDFYLCELGVRVPGGVMDKIFYYATGIDLADLQLKLAISDKINLNKNSKSIYKNIYVKFLNAIPNVLSSGEANSVNLRKAKETKEVLEVDFFVDPRTAHNIPKLNTGGDRYIYILSANNDSINQAINNAYKALSLISIKDKDDNQMNYKYDGNGAL
jgi:biotin carboxylase